MNTEDQIGTIEILSLPHKIYSIHPYDMPDSLNYGNTYLMSSVITINKEIDINEKELTLLHEVIHVISNELGLALDEQAVQRISVGLYDTIKRNPDIFSINFPGVENVQGHKTEKTKTCATSSSRIGVNTMAKKKGKKGC